jgi:hypothetical protein
MLQKDFVSLIITEEKQALVWVAFRDWGKVLGLRFG